MPTNEDLARSAAKDAAGNAAKDATGNPAERIRLAGLAVPPVDARLHQNIVTFETRDVLGGGGTYLIQCLVCGTVSYNRNDFDNEYCPRCRKYHADMARELAMGGETGDPLTQAEILNVFLKSTRAQRMPSLGAGGERTVEVLEFERGAPIHRVLRGLIEYVRASAALDREARALAQMRLLRQGSSRDEEWNPQVDVISEEGGALGMR